MTDNKVPDWVAEEVLAAPALSSCQEAVLMVLAEELKDNTDPLEITQEAIAKMVNEYGILDKPLKQWDISSTIADLREAGLVGDAKNEGKGHKKAYFVTSAGFSHAGIMPSYEPRKADRPAEPGKRKVGRSYPKKLIKDLGDGRKLVSMGHGRFEGTRPGPDGSTETRAWTRSISTEQAIKEWEAWALPNSSAPEQWLVLERGESGAQVILIVNGMAEATRVCNILRDAAAIRREKLIYSAQLLGAIPGAGDAQ